MKTKPVIFGISGPHLTEKEKEIFAKNQVYGFILFARNIESKDQLKELAQELKGLYPDREVPIFVDQEGGRVARLKPPVIDSVYPPAEKFGKLYVTEGKDTAIEQTKVNYRDLMLDLKKFGINSPCAPVADLYYEGADKVIGDRSFGGDVGVVVDLCKAAIDGLMEAGGIAIMKHIPGHGRAACDSHLELPRVTTRLDELDTTDFEVFRLLSTYKGVWAMTAHIIFDALDPDLPVTLSPKAVKFIREKIGFKGILVSDDINMLALHGDIGAKYALVKNCHKKLMQQVALSADENLRCNEIESDFSAKSKHDQIKCLQGQLAELKPKFTDSISNVAYSSLEAGCDLVLHCSGDIEEITVVCAVV